MKKKKEFVFLSCSFKRSAARMELRSLVKAVFFPFRLSWTKVG